MTDDLVGQVLSRLAAQRELLEAVRQEVDSIVVRVSSSDGSIEAEVDGRGELTGLKLTDRAYTHGPAGIASGIVATAGAAARLAAARQLELVARLSARLAAPPTPLHQSGAVPRPRQSRTAADDVPREESVHHANGFDDAGVLQQ